MLRPLWLAASGIVLSLADPGAQHGSVEFDPFAFSNLCHHVFGRTVTTPAAARLLRARWIRTAAEPVATCSALPTRFTDLPAVGGSGDASVDLDVGYDADTQRLCYVSSTLPVAPVIYVGVGHTLSIAITDTLQDSGSGDVTNCPIESFEGEGNYCTPTPIFQEAPGNDGAYYKIDANQAMQADGTTNLHVHGLMVSPKGCGDDTVKSVIYPANWGGDTDDLAACQTGPNTFTYSYRLPNDHPAGLYWYHDHRHGFTEQETQMGLAGAIIVEDGGDLYRQSIGVTDEVLVATDLPIRACLNGVSCDIAPRHYARAAAASAPHPRESAAPGSPTTLDRKVDQVDQVGCAQGATGPNGVQGGEELWNLRLNGANVAETATGFPPDDEVLQKTMQPNQRQIFRLVNAAADSFLSPQLVLVQNGVQTIEPLEVWARDGVGIADANGTRMFDTIDTTTSPLVVPPAGRLEFVVHAPPVGATLYLDTQQVSPGCGGNQYPARRLLLITATGTPVAAGPSDDHDLLEHTPSLKRFYASLGETATVHRTLVFAEYPRGFTYGATDWLTGPPTTANYNQNLVDFYITETASDDGTFKANHVTMTPFDPSSPTAAIVVHLHNQQSVTEEWLIQNSTLEAHDFHIHQIHFRDVTADDTNDNLQPIQDAIVVPPAQLVGSIASGIPGTPGYVKLRMTFTKQDIGEFMFHCHIMEHEDSGMMKYVKVVAD